MNPTELTSLFQKLERTPDAIQEMVMDLSEEEARWAPPGDRWSFVHNICHLRDIEQEGYAVRIEKILGEADPFLADLDGPALAAERQYLRQNVHAALTAFVISRNKNLNRLRKTSPENFGRSGRLEKVGPITLGALIAMLYEHDCVHLNELRDLHGEILKHRAGK